VNLNLLSFTLVNPTSLLVIQKTIMNVANHLENYKITWIDPTDVVMAINPTTFNIGIGN